MYLRILPLIAFITVLVSLSSSKVDGVSVYIAGQRSVQDSSLVQLEKWQSQDSLIPWVQKLKEQSKTLRAEGDDQGCIAKLTKCIDSAWRSPKNEEEFKLFGWVYVNRAYLYDQKLGDFLAAKSDYLAGLKCFESCGYSDILVAKYLYQPLGNIYTRLGENEQAIVMLSEFLRICKEEKELDVLVVAHNDLGRAYMNKEAYTKAIELFDKGIALNPTDYYRIGLLESSKAEALVYQKKFDDGAITARNSLEHLKLGHCKMQITDYQFEACGRYICGAQTILGTALLKQNRFEESAEMFQAAIENTERYYSGKHRRKAKILNGLGDCYRAANDFQKSVDCYQNALISSISNFDDQEITHNPSDELMYADVVIGEALINKARATFSMFQETQQLNWLELSADTYQTYFRWVKRLRAEQLNLQSKLDLTTEIHQIGEETLNVLYLLMEESNDASLAYVALEILEQTKGIVLSESNASSRARNFNIEIGQLVQEMDQFEMQRSLFQIELNAERELRHEKETIRLKRRITELDRKLQVANFQLRKNYPSYDRMRAAENDQINFKKLTRYLEEQKTDLITYFEGEKELFAIVVNLQGVTFSKLNREKYEEVLPVFFTQLNVPGTAHPKTYAKAASEMYTVLFATSKKTRKSNLIILPDGALNQVPFEALVIKSTGNESSYKKLNYLVLENTIHYAPSLKFLLQPRSKLKAVKNYLGIAPGFKKSNNFDYLPHSGEEVNNGKEFFSGDVFVDHKATKSKFLKNADDYRLIHLSTHAGIGSGKNNDGWIAFHSQKKASKMLTPELLQLDLSARLVVLNGCETGMGEVFSGEGMLSMARGFIEAGAHSTITNLWQVNHASNAKLMRSFYTRLDKGNSPSEALSKAKIDYLNDDEVDNVGAHPFYWSASVLIGTNSEVAIQNEESYSVFLIVGIGLFVLSIFVLFYFRKQKR